jgi:hypothetical protein
MNINNEFNYTVEQIQLEVDKFNLTVKRIRLELNYGVVTNFDGKNFTLKQIQLELT